MKGFGFIFAFLTTYFSGLFSKILDFFAIDGSTYLPHNDYQPGIINNNKLGSYQGSDKYMYKAPMVINEHLEEYVPKKKDTRRYSYDIYHPNGGTYYWDGKMETVPNTDYYTKQYHPVYYDQVKMSYDGSNTYFYNNEG